MTDSWRLEGIMNEIRQKEEFRKDKAYMNMTPEQLATYDYESAKRLLF